MNRIFHARITWYQYLFLILTGSLAFWLLWDKAILMALLCMLLLIILIERFIHTTYTVTPQEELVISHGRFSRNRRIHLADIQSVEKQYVMKAGSFYLTSFVLIAYKENKYVSVLPVKEKEFIELLRSKINKSKNT